ATADRAGHHSCGAHARRARTQTTASGSRRTLSVHRKGFMQTRIEVGILGATGMVGQHFIRFLQGHPWFDLKWLGASDRSAGKHYQDSMTWHSAGTVPETITDLTVDECKPGNAPPLPSSAMEAGVPTGAQRPLPRAR